MSRFSFLCFLVWTHFSWTCLGHPADAPPAEEIAKSAAQPPQRGKVLRRSYFFQEAGRPMEYALYVPTGYRPEKPAPLLVLLHGLGSNPLQVIQYQGIIAQAEKRGYIVVAPNGYNVAGWYGSQGPGCNFKIDWMVPPNSPANLGALSEKDVFNVLAQVRTLLRTDPRRTYLAGHSMGGAGTLYLGAKYPSEWAAVAALAPAHLEQNDASLKSLQHTPVLVVQGDADILVKPEQTRQIIAALTEFGVPHQYVEIKGGDHLFSIADNPQMIAKVFDFLDANHR